MKASLRFYLAGLVIATITGWSTYSIVLGQPPQLAVDALRAAEDARAEAAERIAEQAERIAEQAGRFADQAEAFEGQSFELPVVAEVKRSRADVVIERTIRTELKKLQGDVTADVKQSVQKALVKNVGLLFDFRQKQRESELDNMEKELKRLREVHARREAEKEKIVNDRVQQLVREKEGLGWGDSRRHENVDWAIIDDAMPADVIEVPVAPAAPAAAPVPAIAPRPAR